MRTTSHKASRPDPRLDPFRDSVWELLVDGRLVAHLTTEVIPMRSLPAFWIPREWLWYQVTWLDGRRERADEDYGPGWYTVEELEQGRFELDSLEPGAETVFQARRLEGTERDAVWSRLGPPQ